ncbi:polysaccharide biosynthesis/export family protein [Melaminivora sp.]|uniref:polysaccharide biosynthesis/export family protein n=1 Tax=Melaminivora sp. TaxID=1933032 RepID=UPI0028AE6D6C|nr:polysaccharide biosynthesis/export family protein [Melaminivora sp.]
MRFPDLNQRANACHPRLHAWRRRAAALAGVACAAWVLWATPAAAMAQQPLGPQPGTAAVAAQPGTEGVQALPTTLPGGGTPGVAGTAAAQPLPTGGYAAPARAGAAPAAPGGRLQPAPATIDADYKIGPNDLLEVDVFGVTELKRTVRVNSTGHISMPLIGLVQVAGLTPSDAEALIALQYSKNYLQDPQVSIFIKEFTTQRITVDGAVVRPGIYPLVGQITLLRALAMAGGGGQLAKLDEVMLFRVTPEGDSQTEKHDVMKIRAGEAPDPTLRGDDVVVVNRDSQRTALRDSLFRDIIDTINPFSASYRNAVAP